MEKVKKILEIMICMTIIFILGIVAWYYGDLAYETQKQYSEGEDVYEDVTDSYVSSLPSFSLPDSTQVQEVSSELEKPPITIDFTQLKTINSEVIGWIYSPFVDINYPVCQTTDNQYYVTHTYDRKVISCGSIFMDYRNNPDLSDLNTIIYGHSMRNNTMFHPFQQYFNDEGFYETAKYFYYLTPEVNYKMNIIACVIVPCTGTTYDPYYLREDFENYLTSMAKQNLIDNDFDPKEISQVVAFSQCCHVYSGARYVLLCEPEVIGK